MFNLYVESLRETRPIVEEGMREFFSGMTMRELVNKILAKLPDPTSNQKILIHGLIAVPFAHAIGNGARQFYDFLTGRMPEDNFFQFLSELLK